MSDETPTATDRHGLIGVGPGADLTVPEEKELDYVSKSRVKTYTQCPRKFWYKYWTETRPPTNFYMERGKRLHRAFETFHENLFEYVKANGWRPTGLTELLGDWRDWSQWTDMVANFFRFEERRWRECDRSLTKWLPVGVEMEGWLGEPPSSWDGDPDRVGDEPPMGNLPWMGLADVLHQTKSIPGVEGSGVTVLDYKTGSVPDPVYRDKGIFLEGEYYGMIFEEFFEIDAVAGYYPQEDVLMTAPYPDDGRRLVVLQAVQGMSQEPDQEHYERREGPLCHYGDGKCFFYDPCEPDWGNESKSPAPEDAEGGHHRYG